MNVGNALSPSTTQPLNQAQVSLIKKSEDLQKKNVMQLINSVSGVTAPSRASGGNPPGVGQNLNVVA